MRDQYGRSIEYLRISVTDRCNLRCAYCIPREGLEWLPREALLRYEEVDRLVGVFVRRGLRKVRLTGGEPAARADLLTLVRLIGARPEIRDFALSTNGLRLDRLADPLAEAGLKRINVSLDSLDPERVRTITGGGRLGRVLEGLEAAERAGLEPIKINVVALRGRNDDEIEDFAALTRSRPWHVRFIEMMPLEGNVGSQPDLYVSTGEVLARLRRLDGLETAPAPAASGPARHYRFPGAPGTLGVISPLSHDFCDRCNRVRLTADGRLRLCLYGDDEIDLRGPLRAGASDDDIAALLDRGMSAKPLRHGLEVGRSASRLVALSQVGG